MWAERAAAKIDRDYEKAARRMNQIKASMDEAQRVYDAKQALQAARVESHAEGRKKGRAEGILEIARKMKTMGDPVEKIQTITGLSPEEIAKL